MSPATNIPRSVRLSKEVSERVSAFLKAHPSYSYADIENLALANLMNKLDDGSRLIDAGKGLQVVAQDGTAPEQTGASTEQAPVSRAQQALHTRLLKSNAASAESGKRNKASR